MKIITNFLIQFITYSIVFTGFISNLSASPESNFKTFCTNNYSLANKKFKSLKNTKNTNIHLLQEINALDIVLDKSYNKSSLFYNVHPNAKVREEAEKCEILFSNLFTEISLEKSIYLKLKAIPKDELDEFDIKFLDDMLFSYERSGVNLNKAKRSRIKKINKELTKISQKFSKNIRSDVRYITLENKEMLKGLPKDYIKSHLNKDGSIKISTDYPDYFPLIKYAKNDEVKKRAYLEFKNRAYPQNESVLQELLEKRYELANILGYKNFADYVTENKMIGNSRNAQEFIDKISDAAKRKTKRDYFSLLVQVRKDLPDTDTVKDWHRTYYSEQIKKEKYLVDSKEVRKYFLFSNVKEGLFKIVKRLFDIEIVPRKVGAWSADVEAYTIKEKGKVLGHFYLDLHPRKTKYKHAAMFPLISGVKGKQAPEAVLVCNFPGKENPSELMEHGQVKTFFHEFGHLLHHILGGNQKWLALSGTATERDFVEAPSQMFEEWAWNYESLKLFARNKEGEIIPQELVKKMNRAAKYGNALEISQQIFYSSISLNYYNRKPDFNLLHLMKDLQKYYSAFDYVDGTYFYSNFGHLTGYSAVYYTYMWSLAISKDLFSHFDEKGIFNKEVAQKYRKLILEPGGSKKARDLIQSYLGREFNLDAFKKDLAY